MMSTPLLALAVAAMQAQTPALPAADSPPGSVLFVAQCRYAAGARALLYHGFSADDYVLALHAGTAIGTWRITPQADGGLMLDAVTVGRPREADARAVADLYGWLVQRSFRAVRVSGFAAEAARQDADSCPEPYPFGG